MKKLCFILILFSISVRLHAQGEPDLDRFTAIAKTQYPQIDSLERVYYRLNYFDSISPTKEQELKLMEIYKNIANGFSLNFHFKQGYNAYQKYLSLKEKKLTAEKAEIIGKTKDEYDQKDRSAEDEVLNLQNQLQQLKAGSETLVSRRSTFKSVFTFVIVILSVMFAFSLFRSGVKLKNLNEEARSNRDKVMSHHRTAVIGSLAKGLKETINKNNHTLRNESTELLNMLPETNKVSDLKAKLVEMVKLFV